MAVVHKSALKRNRQNAKRRLANRHVTSMVKTAAKRVSDALETGDLAAAKDRYREFASLVDGAARRGRIPANRAAHRKSKLARRINRAGTASAPGGSGSSE